MDGKGKQEIKKYILIFIFMAFSVSAVTLVIAGHEEREKRYQISALSARYPQMEGDIVRILEKGYLDSDFTPEARNGPVPDEKSRPWSYLEKKYGYDYVEAVLGLDVWKVCGFSIVLTGIILVALWGISGRGKNFRGYQENLKKAEDIIHEFRRGNYSVPEGIFKGREPEHIRGKDLFYASDEDMWMKMEESLRELGTFLDDRKLRYENEDDRTKALITDISHQLKTPLASLRMSHELIMSDYPSDEERKEFLAQEETEIIKLQELLEELVLLSRLEKRMIRLKPEEAGLRDTISQAVSVIYPKAMGKSINIQVQMEEDIQVIHDVGWTSEAFTNILDNAVKYSPENTEILIRVQKMANCVMIEFLDEGPGIKDEDKHRIFQRFYRGKNSDGVEGAGVGLYLARQILEQEKGSIMVKNRVPGGCVFRVLLPL